jgi:HPt (histidine-containing phosphotransfer) domain-containing protein
VERILLPLTTDVKSKHQFFDGAAVLERFGGDVDFAAECSQVLANGLPAMIQALHDGMEIDSAEQVFRAAHTLKGALSNFLSDGPTKTAARIENLARDEQLAEASDAIATLEREITMLMSGLRDLQLLLS